MSAVSEVLHDKSSSQGLPVILTAGLIAGTMDITAACVVAYLRAGVTPLRVMKYIASGLLGPTALAGGAGTAVLGTILHYIIATGAATVFYFASRKIRFMTEYPLLSGPLYAVLVYIFMNFLVVPLSQVPKRPVPVPLSSHIIQCLILVFCIGLPIAFIVRRGTR